MEPGFSPMRDTTKSILAGSFSSDGLEIETPWHYHDLHQLLYAFEDSVEVQGELAHYKVPHQFAAWIPAGTVHRTTLQNVRSGSIFFSPTLLHSPIDHLRVIPATSLMREMILYAMRWPIDAEDNEASLVFYRCFANLCREWAGEEVKLVLPSTDDSRINSIVKFTSDNLSSVSLIEVCKAVAMSERTLRRRFLKEMGISWDDYRLRLRMYRAIDALDNSSKPIGDIAADVGYSSQAAFSNAFRTLIGISPTAYRRTR